jgi:hypothetical protein
VDPVAVSRRRLANTAVIVLEGSSRDGWHLARRIEDHLPSAEPQPASGAAPLW